MPRRIGINNGIASVAWEWLVTGRGQPFDAFGATHFSLTRSDLLCRPKDFALALRGDLALLVYWLARNVGGGCDGHRPLFDGANQFRGTVVADFGRAFHTALANIEKIGGLSLGQVANWRLAPISAVAERRQLGRQPWRAATLTGACA